MAESPTKLDLLTAGDDTGERVDISIGPKFLKLFSEQLYTSPNKAFEELVSNSWDAGAASVHIGVPEDLKADGAVLWVLDDGESMTVEQMRLLWAVGDDHKARDDWETPQGRKPIGKFGIGKLATYVLADQLTYVCKAANEPIRAISVDYRDILSQGDATALHVEPVPLIVRELSVDEFHSLLDDLALEDLKALFDEDRMLPYVGESPVVDEYGAPSEEPPSNEPSDTWTLAALSSLKERGRKVSRGHLKRMLRAALPLGASIRLVMDGDELVPSIADIPTQLEWSLGSDFKAGPITPESDLGGAGDEDPSEDSGDDDQTVDVVNHDEDSPWVEIPGLGQVSGRIVLYERTVTSNKSEARGPSNGVFINVAGRVINLHDSRFGMPAMTHAVWNRVRITLRADGLNPDLAVTRESVEAGERVALLRGLIRQCFNAAKREYARTSTFPDIHQLLNGEYGTVPIAPLLHVVEHVVDQKLSTSLIDTSGADVQSGAEWRARIESDPGSALSQVKTVEKTAEEPLSTYGLQERTVLVNSNHPLWIDLLTGRADKADVLSITATVSVLTDAYLIETGVDPSLMDEVRSYRDQVERLVAHSRRRSAPLLADALDKAGTDSKALEHAVRNCLEHLGFDAVHQAQSGKPEGIATADLAPGEQQEERRYRFIYEAKSTRSASKTVSTKDVNISGQDRHRRHAAADTDDPRTVEYALVVAPGFQAGALEDEAEHIGKICPMTTHDLGRLIMGAAATGPLDQWRFRRVLECTDPARTGEAITELLEDAKESAGMSISELVEALKTLDNVSRIAVSTISEEIRRNRRAKQEQGAPRVTRPNEIDVQRLVSGLQMLVPSGIQVVSNNVILGTSPDKLAEAIQKQVALLPGDQQFGLGQIATAGE